MQIIINWRFEVKRPTAEDINPPKKRKEKKRERKPRKKKRHRLNKETRLAVLQRDDCKCQECGSTDGLHIHHKQPRANGGSDDLNNLVTLCEACHTAKHEGEPVHRLMRSRLAGYPPTCHATPPPAQARGYI